MPPINLELLSEAGGWVVAAATLIGVIGLLLKGLLIPGPVYQREVKRSDELDERLDTMADAMKEQTGSMRTLLALSERRDGPR